MIFGNYEILSKVDHIKILIIDSASRKWERYFDTKLGNFTARTHKKLFLKTYEKSKNKKVRPTITQIEIVSKIAKTEICIETQVL